MNPMIVNQHINALLLKKYLKCVCACTDKWLIDEMIDG